MSSPRIAWLGLGNMGRGMVKNLVEKGQFSGAVQIYNRTTSRSTDLASKLPQDKVSVAKTIPDAVSQADIIFTCVGDDAAIRETMAAALDAAGNDASSKLFVDCSTVHPDTTNELASLVEKKGATFAACPVFGAPAMADSGQLVCVLAGPQKAVDRVKPFCKGVMGRAEIDFGDQPAGNASRLKVIGNTMILHMVEALSEGHTLAEGSGLGVDNFHSFIETMFPGPYTAYSNRLKSGDYYNRDSPLFQAKLAKKDYNHAKSLADAGGVQLKGLDVAGKHLQDVIDHMDDKGDIAGIYGAVRKESGMKFEN